VASRHYAKDTIQWSNDNSVKFVQKEHNPPNVPEIRPIEKFWAHCKRKLQKQKKITRMRKTSMITGKEW
jgi:transposase